MNTVKNDFQAMEVNQIIVYQTCTGNICLQRQGLFFRGYNQGAIMLEAIMNYKVKAVFMKSCKATLCSAGFPSVNLPKVIAAVVEQGGKIVKQDELVVEIEGLTYSCSDEIVNEYKLKEQSVQDDLLTASRADSGESLLISKLMSFDLSNSTPMQALLFLGDLQRIYRVMTHSKDELASTKTR